jgi:hypothetical protein
VRAKYEWRRGNKWEHLAMDAHGEAQSCALGSHEQFITEHYWGYTARARHAVAGERRRSERTSEYRIEHPRWKIWLADSFELKADIATLYGEKFVEPLTAKPVSAFIADGSYVEVQRRTTEP